MNANTLFSYIEIKGIRPAQLARRVGISRQTLSEWKKKSKTNSNINIYSQTQEKLAFELGLRYEDLNRAIEVLENKNLRKEIETELFWDKLYKNIESFSSAVIRGQPEALARLVQVYGLYASAKIAGNQIWDKFHLYKNKIHPAYRKQAEVLWKLAQSQT
ncbi:MAG TPA: helix-turn-helix transcriptional regulator [Pseudobdellovibrionaceae bacterium]|nr:helix-turn-helix transcriptional regulator [Pseudobdellovibrionaceae bacterium]